MEVVCARERVPSGLLLGGYGGRSRLFPPLLGFPGLRLAPLEVSTPALLMDLLMVAEISWFEAQCLSLRLLGKVEDLCSSNESIWS